MATDPEINLLFPVLPDFLKIVDMKRGPLRNVSKIRSSFEEEVAASG
jgi:predicted methyltransferase